MDTYPDSMRKGLYAIFFMFFLFSTIVSFGSDFYGLVNVFFLVFFIRTLYLIYVNERFTAFMVHAYLGTHLSLIFLTAISFYVAGYYDFGQSMLDSISLAMVPVLLFVVFFLAIYFTRSGAGRLPYGIYHDKVSITPVFRSHVAGNIFGGVVFIVTMALMISETVNQGILLGSMIGILTLYLMYFSRDSIRIVKAVLADEKKHGRRYTFDNIEQLREARSRWWLGRLFKWLVSLRQS